MKCLWENVCLFEHIYTKVKVICSDITISINYYITKIKVMWCTLSTPQYLMIIIIMSYAMFQVPVNISKNFMVYSISGHEHKIFVSP